MILLASNNYLGLADHPRIKEAAIGAIRQYGFGSGASRLISGDGPAHEALEKRIAQFKQTEAALLFNTGYMANIGILPCLIPSKGLVLADRLCHASLIDGCRATGGRFRVYDHRDLDQLERLLRKKPKEQPSIIVTDGVFSMDGDIAPLPKLVELADRYNGLVYVDDAHATGVIGKKGRGSVDHFGLEPGRVIQMGTLGKALGGFGAFVAGSRPLIDFLINKSKTFIFTTALPPAVAAGALAAFDLLEEEPHRLERLWENRNYYAAGLKSLGFDTLNSETPIIPILIGDDRLAMNVSQRLLEAGVFAPAIRPPTVPKGTSRIRTTITASHMREDIDHALECFGQIARFLGIR